MTQPLDCQLGYWNRLGPTKPFHHPVNAERLAAHVGLDARILDYGCGYGRVLGDLHALGYRRLAGVDPARAMIVEARHRFPSIRFDEMTDPPRAGLGDASMDAVLLFTVLTCVPSDEGQRAVLAEIRRLLRPGGLLYISDLWLQTDARNVERYLRDQPKYGTYGVFDLEEGATMRHHDAAWIATLTAGYDRTALDAFEVETMNGHVASAFQWFGVKR